MKRMKSVIKINNVKFYQAIRVVKEITFLENEYFDITFYPETGILAIFERSRPNHVVFSTISNVCYMTPFADDSYLETVEEVYEHVKPESSENIKDTPRAGKKKN